MNFADYCSNQLEFLQIVTNRKNIHYKVYKPLGKRQR